MKIEELYEKYVSKTRNLASVSSVKHILGWDQQTMMPWGGGSHRAKQMSSLAGVIHEISTDPDLGKTLLKLHDAGPDFFDCYQWRNIEDSLRSFLETKNIPTTLMERAANLEAQGFSAWKQARESCDFFIFAPILEEWVELRKRMADSMYPDKEPYEVCLDGFERGLNCQGIDSIFEKLKMGLLPLIEEFEGCEIPQFPQAVYSRDKQEELMSEIATQLGFDFKHGRLDSSIHPFTLNSHRSDVRVTVRYDEETLLPALGSLTHEVGHGMYEQGLMSGEHDQLPVARALGMMIHESQSLIWERMVFQGKAFWKYFQPLIFKMFPENLGGVEARELYRRVNRVTPGLIRTAADELCYPLHIILRYEIEKDLFSGKIKVKDLPSIWKDRSSAIMGLEPAHDNEGLLQDVHWSAGAFGYFPLYSLGAIAGTQFYHQACVEIPDLEERLARGEFRLLRDWLNQKVHRRGCLLTAHELLKDVTGKHLDISAYLRYLRNKTTEIYRLN
jgi:carboxypeptidase Taq